MSRIYNGLKVLSSTQHTRLLARLRFKERTTVGDI